MLHVDPEKFWDKYYFDNHTSIREIVTWAREIVCQYNHIPESFYFAIYSHVITKEEYIFHGLLTVSVTT